jgi:hypothetical protein
VPEPVRGPGSLYRIISTAQGQFLKAVAVGPSPKYAKPETLVANAKQVR